VRPLPNLTDVTRTCVQLLEKRHAFRLSVNGSMKNNNYIIRELCEADLTRGFQELLAQLTSTGPVSLPMWQERLQFRQQRKETYLTLVAVDGATDQVVGTATLIIEHKFTRGCGNAGHIEDVVVDAGHRQQQLGSQLVRELMDRAQNQYACYKVTLCCSEQNASFYAKLGLERKGVQMARYFG
jgi:glucosamine-phosphate N-acetyltransferase